MRKQPATTPCWRRPALGRLERSRLQSTIGVQEQKHVAGGVGGAVVHLGGAARSREQLIRAGGREGAGFIGAAAVHHQDFPRPLLAHRRNVSARQFASFKVGMMTEILTRASITSS